MKNLIEKLKDKDYVRAFGLMKPEEQKVYRKVGKKNCIFYNSGGNWLEAINYGDNFSRNFTYAIKPDYQPEPEYDDYKLDKNLYEELRSIKIASNLGNNKEPVWDGTVIGKPQQHILEDMGLVECFHGYYFLTEKGKEAYKNYKPEPEYVDLEIGIYEDVEGVSGERLGVSGTSDLKFLSHGYLEIHELPSLPNFDGFWLKRTDEPNLFHKISLDDVALDYKRENQIVYARFRK
jgi:hypothetical protein